MNKVISIFLASIIFTLAGWSIAGAEESSVAIEPANTAGVESEPVRIGDKEHGKSPKVRLQEKREREAEEKREALREKRERIRENTDEVKYLRRKIQTVRDK